LAAALGPVVGTFEFDTTEVRLPIPIHLDGEYYAVTYRRSATSSWLKTYRIIANGTISEVDTWEFSTENSEHPRLKHISGDLYAINYHFYVSPYNYGRLKTLHISNAGVITKSFDDTHEIAAQEYWGFLFQILGNVYALIAGDSPVNHFVYTFTISSGAGGIALVDSYNYRDVGYHVMAAGQIGANIVFAVFSYDSAYSIWTFHIASDGTITTPYKDYQDFAITINHSILNIVKVSSNIYAIAMWDTDTNEVAIQTFKINSDGSIQATLVDSLNFGNCIVYCPGICRTDAGTRYFVVYPGTDQDGFIDIIKIDTLGSISDDPSYSVFEFDDVNCVSPQPLPLNGAWMPIFYRGPDNDGFIKTVTFTLPPAGAHHEMIMKIGP